MSPPASEVEGHDLRAALLQSEGHGAAGRAELQDAPALVGERTDIIIDPAPQVPQASTVPCPGKSKVW